MSIPMMMKGTFACLGSSSQHHVDCLRSSTVRAKRPKKAIKKMRVDSDDESHDAG